MVKPKAIRCAKIPLPLRSQRVSLGSLAGAGTRPTSSSCMAMPSRPVQSSKQRLLPGLRSRRRRRLQERLLPGEASGPCGGGAHSALCRLGGKRFGPQRAAPGNLHRPNRAPNPPSFLLLYLQGYLKPPVKITSVATDSRETPNHTLGLLTQERDPVF